MYQRFELLVENVLINWSTYWLDYYKFIIDSENHQLFKRVVCLILKIPLID